MTMGNETLRYRYNRARRRTIEVEAFEHAGKWWIPGEDSSGLDDTLIPASKVYGIHTPPVVNERRKLRAGDLVIDTFGKPWYVEAIIDPEWSDVPYLAGVELGGSTPGVSREVPIGELDGPLLRVWSSQGDDADVIW